MQSQYQMQLVCQMHRPLEAQDPRSMQHSRKRREEQKRLVAMEEKLFDLEYTRWINQQDKNWLHSLLEPGVKFEGERVATWRVYFKNNIWSKKSE